MKRRSPHSPHGARHLVGRVLVVIALVLSIGLHWMLVQSAGWATMLVSFAQEGSLMAAVEKTFDGEHPCEFCKLATRGVQEDQKKDSISHEVVKLVMDRFDDDAFVLGASCTVAAVENTDTCWPMRSEPPVGPPPRGVIV